MRRFRPNATETWNRAVLSSLSCHSPVIAALIPIGGRATGKGSPVFGWWPSARVIRPRGRGVTASREYMNPRTGSDAAEPLSRPPGDLGVPGDGLAVAKKARDWGVIAPTRSDAV
jgi:hypothetical protein